MQSQTKQLIRGYPLSSGYKSEELWILCAHHAVNESHKND